MTDPIYGIYVIYGKCTHRIHGAAIYGVPWIPSIYPIYVSIYSSTMDPEMIQVSRESNMI